MGQAATLFFRDDDETLHHRIIPSEQQEADQQGRWQELAEHLKATVAAELGYTTKTWLQGSYKMATQVRPPHKEDFDIDLGLYLEWSGAAQTGPQPSVLRSSVQRSLQAYAANFPDDVKEVVAPKSRCLRIVYTGGFHVDVPVYHLEPTRGVRTLATSSGWEASDPKAVVTWFQNFVEEPYRSAVRRCVRYLKAWAALKVPAAARPSSIVLTVLVAEAAQAIRGTGLPDDELFAAIVAQISARLGRSTAVPNPADRNEDLMRLDRQSAATFSNEVASLTSQAARATVAQSPMAAAMLWQDAFAHLFPLPIAAAGLPATASTPQVAVTAAPIRGNGPQLSGVNRIGPVPKDYRVSFRVSNVAQLPMGAQVTWVVRNAGNEAEDTNDMGHLAGSGMTAEETTAYRGTHFMDCIVRQQGVLVAVQRVPVLVSGLALPPRNPPRRPAYRWI